MGNSTSRKRIISLKGSSGSSGIGATVLQQGYDASTNLFPTAINTNPIVANITMGMSWYITVAGTLGTTSVIVGDEVIALTNTPGQVATNWLLLNHTIGYTPENTTNKSTDGTLTANSDTLYASQKATKTYADTKTTLAIVDAQNLSAFAATTSAQLASIISDETGTNKLVFSDSPTLVTPVLGTPTTLVGTNITGTASSLTSGNVTTNANLTGPVTSIGNATTIANSINLPGAPTTSTQSANDNSTKIATTAYVDSALSSFNSKPDVAYASITPLPNNTYSNGASGVGATLTGASNGPLVIDSITLVIGQAGERVLIAGEAQPANNGWYTITQVGVIAVSPYILTRAVESDQAAEIGAGYLTGVIAPNTVVPGSANNGKVFISIAADPFIVGTTSLTFSQVGSTYSAGSGLTLSGSTFSIGSTQVVNSMVANTTIDLTTKVTGLLPDANISSAAKWNNAYNLYMNSNFN